MPVQREANDEKHWYAWVGDVKQLERLVQTLDDLIKDQRQRELEKSDEQSVRRGIADNPNRSEIEELWQVRMEWKERELNATYRGTPEEVLKEVDHHAEVEVVKLSAPGFSRSGGAVLQVRGDPRWVRAASSELASQLHRWCSWWGYFRSNSFYTVVVSLGVISLFLAVVVALIGGLSAWPRIVVSAAFSALLFVAAALASRIPGVEITEPGGQGSTRRVIGIFGALAGGLLTNLVTYLITK